jgi:hypothetical protein
MKTTQIAHCLCAVTIPTATSIAFAAGQAAPAPAASSATATAVDLTDFVPFFRAEAFVADDIIVPPTHPPIDLIPALPMPNPDFEGGDSPDGPGNALFYNPETRVTTEFPMNAFADRVDPAVAVGVDPALHEPAAAADRVLDVPGLASGQRVRDGEQAVLLLGVLLAAGETPQQIQVPRLAFPDDHHGLLARSRHHPMTTRPAQPVRAPNAHEIQRGAV